VIATGRNSARSDYIETLARAEQVIRRLPDPEPPPLAEKASGPLQIGVDLGTAYLVLAVLDQDGQPLAGEYQFAQVVRDGLVVDYLGAIDLLVEMKSRVETRLGRQLTHAASGYPPGVPQVEVRAMANVVEAAGLRCTTMVDEPSAANAVLELNDGAIVDVGGGTTGIAILEDGKVVYTADEATGGTHFSLVVAGAQDISFEAAEEMKVNPAEQKRLFPIVRPVMEKVGNIVARHVRISQVEVVGTITQGDLPVEGMASLYIEMAPGNEVFRTVDIAVKATEAKPGAQVVEREFGMFEIHSLNQADVLESGRIVLERLGLAIEDRIRPQVASVQLITNVDPYQAQLLNRWRRGSMLVPGQTLLVVECFPAAYINYACNEAEKKASIDIVHVSSVGRFGRMWLSGTEAETETARDASIQALERLEGVKSEF